MKHITYILVLLIVASCINDAHNTNKTLEKVENLVKAEKYDSAYTILRTIKPTKLNNDDEKAFYGLLMTQICNTLEKQLINDTLIDFCIKHYQKTGNRLKLARAYYFKSMCLFDASKEKEALTFIKKAEANIQWVEDPWLVQHVYINISYINEISGAYRTALKYALKALKKAERTNNVTWKCIALDRVGICYESLGILDSTDIYINKIIPLLDKVNDKETRSVFLNNIGSLWYRQGKYVESEKVFRQAEHISPISTTRLNLAKVCYILKKDVEVDSLMKEAWEGASFEEKKEILDFLADKAKKEKQFETAAELYKKSQIMQDSITMKRKTEEIVALQDEQDKQETEQKTKEREAAIWVLFFVVMSFLAISSVYVYRKSVNRARKEMDKNKKALDRLTSMLEEAELSKKDNEHEIKRLKHAAGKLKDKIAAILDRGRELCDGITAGGTTARWAKKDFEAAVEYMRVKNQEKIKEIEKSYSRITAYNTYFLLLDAMGTSTDEMARIMNISTGAVRTMRHRLRKRQDKKD